MREGLDQWNFVLAAYAFGILATLLLVAHSWLAMRRAEARRAEVKRPEVKRPEVNQAATRRK